MKVGYELRDYASLEEICRIDVGLSKSQRNALQNGEQITLSPSQLDYVTKQLDADSFLQDHLDYFTPVSMSLYVTNDALWKMMERKTWEPEKMLPMTTMPYCHWDHREESIRNPKAVKREKMFPNRITIRENQLRIEGAGGDFEGFIERSYLTARKFGLPETRKLIPNYKFYDKIVVDILLDSAQIEIHPNPIDEFDYDFSESARVFYEHGVLLSLPGEHVELTVGKKPKTQLKGDVYTYIGKKVEPDKNRFEELIMDLWLWLFRLRVD